MQAEHGGDGLPIFGTVGIVGGHGNGDAAVRERQCLSIWSLYQRGIVASHTHLLYIDK